MRRERGIKKLRGRYDIHLDDNLVCIIGILRLESELKVRHLHFTLIYRPRCGTGYRIRNDLRAARFAAFENAHTTTLSRRERLRNHFDDFCESFVAVLKHFILGSPIRLISIQDIAAPEGLLKSILDELRARFGEFINEP